MTNYANIRYQPAAASTTTVADMAALIALTGMSNGDQALVQATNKLYMYSGTGWYIIATIQNDAPSAITGVSGTYELAVDGTATTITAASTDPEGFPLTWSYSTSGLGSIATVSNTDNVFTITPSTTEADAGTFTLTINATDGVNGAVSTSTNLILEFIVTVTNSRYTTLLATATPKNTTVYRYFKFVPQAMRSATPDAMQYSEFELTDGTSYYSPSSASQLYRVDDTDGDDYTASQNVAASIDGNTSTKLFNGGWASKYYLYDMGSSFSTALTGWRYKTGDDSNSRDPVSWTLLGSTNNTDWVILDQRTQETITTSRQTATQDFTFNATNQAVFNAANTNYPIEVNGDAHAGTFSPYRSGGYSTKFEPDSYFNILNQPAIGSGDCSIECWVNVSTLSHWHGIIKRGANGSAGCFQFYVRNDTELYLNWSGTQQNTSGANIQINTWHWLQVIRSSGTVTIYVDGVSRASFDGNSDIQSTTFYDIGGWTGNFSEGFIRDLRVSTVARSSSTGPSDKLEVDSDTTFLTCNSPYVTFSTPSAVNNYVQYISGPISTKPFSPYDYLEYSATDYGGSVHFDGSGDKLAVGGSASDFNFGTNSFTIEGWVYSQVAAVGSLFNTHRVGIGSGYYLSWVADNTITWGNYVDGTGNVSTGAGAFTQNTWNHISLNRDASSSNSLKIYVNGVLKYTGTSATNYNTFDYGPYIGGYDSGGTQYDFTGHLSDIVVVNGSVLRTGGTSVGDVAFTPPTTPIATPSNTKLHIKGTDASIIDKSQGSNLKLIADTVGSTTQVKFANTKSMYFDGAGDYITIENSEAYGFGTGSWTFEVWLYCTRTGASNAIFDTRVGTGTETGSFGIGMLSTGQVQMFSGGVLYKPAETLSFNVWQHLAIVKNASTNTTTMYFNGTAAATTYSDTRDYGSSQPVQIAKDDWVNYFGGYMQDLRVTKGLARYTANFTPPTASLEG